VVIAAKQEGLLEAYDSPNMANLIDPKLMKDPDNYWAGIYVGSLGFVSNKHFLEKHQLQPPTSSGAAPNQHVGQGEVPVSVVFSHDVIAQLEKGLLLVFSFAQEGMGWETRRFRRRFP
jgi:hypothetical protein